MSEHFARIISQYGFVNLRDVPVAVLPIHLGLWDASKV